MVRKESEQQFLALLVTVYGQGPCQNGGIDPRFMDAIYRTQSLVQTTSEWCTAHVHPILILFYFIHGTALFEHDLSKNEAHSNQ